MLKIKVSAALLFASVCCGFVASRSAGQTRNGTNNQTKKTPSVVAVKAPIKCEVAAARFGLAGDDLKTSIVRAAPDKNSAIVKTVVTKDEVVYSISGSDGKGWFEISKIEAVSDIEKTLFSGRGWVHSSLLDLSVAYSDAKLRAAPSKRSRVMKKLIPEESEARPISCQGDWMKIKSGKSSGWLSRDGQCASPLTTCS
jgi:SH3-like domain-containing protein